MQIVIEKKLENQKIIEWGLLEFQGGFFTRCNEPLFENFIGDLSFNKDGTPFFIVGHHILFGEEVKLPQPFAVLKKKIDPDSNSTKYFVQAVIRRKILFKMRPKPIICSSFTNTSD